MIPEIGYIYLRRYSVFFFKKKLIQYPKVMSKGLFSFLQLTVQFLAFRTDIKSVVMGWAAGDTGFQVLSFSLAAKFATFPKQNK